MEYYDCLGIGKTATESEIKKAFYKCAKIFHPDKNQSKEAEEKFKLCNEAYEVLSDAEKRKKYDLYGKEGLQTKFNPFDFSRKTADIELMLMVSLDEIYYGTTKEVKYERKVNCKKCHGKGTLKEIKNCETCKGQGRTVKIVKNGFMNFQTVEACTVCLGKKYVIPDKDKCKKCHGEGLYDEAKTLNLEIKKGFNKKVFVFREESHILPNMIIGDVIVHIQIKPNVYGQRGNDLLLTHQISFMESINGKGITINHFGKHINIETTNIIQPNSIKKLVNYGMPYGSQYGDLYITFHVIYDFTLEQLNTLKELFHNDVTFNGILMHDVDKLPDEPEVSESDHQPQCTQQ